MVNPGRTGLVAWWSLGEASGTRADSHGTSHASSVNGSPTQAAGLVGNALGLVSPAWLAVPSPSAALTIAVGQPASWWCWVKLNSFVNHTIPMSRWDGSGNWNMTVGLGGICQAAVGNMGSGHSSPATPTITTGTWNFIMCWFDPTIGTHGAVRCRVNSGTVYSTTLPSAITGSALNIRTFIGTLNAGTYGSINGSIDEAGFAHRVYTSDEQDWLYNGGLGRSYADTADSALLLYAAAHAAMT